MKYAAIATGVVVGLFLSAPSWAQKAEAPIAQPRAATIPSPPDTPQRPRIEMPGPAASEGQGSTEAAESTPIRRRPHVRPSRPAVTVNRAEANAFTAELNRRELESLGAGASVGPAVPWREFYPYR